MATESGGSGACALQTLYLKLRTFVKLSPGAEAWGPIVTGRNTNQIAEQHNISKAEKYMQIQQEYVRIKYVLRHLSLSCLSIPNRPYTQGKLFNNQRRISSSSTAALHVRHQHPPL